MSKPTKMCDYLNVSDGLCQCTCKRSNQHLKKFADLPSKIEKACGDCIFNTNRSEAIKTLINATGGYE